MELDQKNKSIWIIGGSVLLVVLISSVVAYFVFFRRESAGRISLPEVPAVISPNAPVNPVEPDTIAATPTPTQTINRPGEYACDPIGICNHYIVTEGMGCPKTFAEPTCSNVCGNEELRCAK